MARTWEEYLFNDHQAVAVSPWKGAAGLQLLDLMVRRNDHYFQSGQAGLRQIGSFFGFGLRKGIDAEDLERVDNLKEALHKFKRQKTTETASTDDSDEDPIIRRETLPSLTETVSASSKNLANVMEYANVKNSSSKALTCTLDNVSLECVDREALRAAIRSWKPDMASLSQYTRPSLFRGIVDVFVITDILYAGHVTVADETSGSIGAGVDTGPASAALIGVEVSAKLEAQHSSGSKKELTGGHIPFAIRVIRLRYTSKGVLYRVLPQSRMPTHRTAQVCVSESDVEIHPPGAEGVGTHIHVSQSEVVVGVHSGSGMVEVAPAKPRENRSRVNSSDPLGAYKCEMSDFFGDDLSDLAGDASVIPLDIDIDADHPAGHRDHSAGHSHHSAGHRHHSAGHRH